MEDTKHKSRPTYSIWDNAAYLLRKSWEMDRGLLLANVAQVPVTVLTPLLAAYLSKSAVEMISANASAPVFIARVLALSLATLALCLINGYLASKNQWRSFGNRFRYVNICSAKIMDMDYDRLENPAGQTKMQKALNALDSNSSGTQQIFLQLVNIASSIIGMIAYSAVLASFSPIIVGLLFSTTAIVHFINDSNNKWLHRNKDNWIPIDRKLNYIQNKSGSFEAAKDIRLYNMLPWFQKLFRLFLDERNIWRKKSERRGLLIDFAATGMGLARDGAVYAMLIWQAANRNISVADFVLYFALAAQYSNWLAGIASSYSQLQSTSLGLCDLRAFLDIENRFNRDKGFPLPGRAPEIVLDNVSFKYPGSSAETIKNINLTIKPGEKIALVGLNGAGKTTLVKLLSGLYAPTDGAIFVAGREMSGYNIDDYYSMFSAVFQEIILMPVSIAKNVALCEEKHIDRGKLLEALKLAGIYGKVMSLPDKENTLLLKNIHETAVELSGGEKQKIALARAIYKNGIIMVLDEPTAALDPVAESMMYQSYNELIKNATSIFISHRLSSTRFCDRILLLEDGRIAEQGSHDQLMAEGGKYASLFSVQSRYYTRVRLGIPTAICGRTEETSITDSR